MRSAATTLTADGRSRVVWRRLALALLTLVASCVLAVPSTVIPHETNYLLNTAHRRFGRISMGAPRTFPIDPRIKSLLGSA